MLFYNNRCEFLNNQSSWMNKILKHSPKWIEKIFAHFLRPFLRVFHNNPSSYEICRENDKNSRAARNHSSRPTGISFRPRSLRSYVKIRISQYRMGYGRFHPILILRDKHPIRHMTHDVSHNTKELSIINKHNR